MLIESSKRFKEDKRERLKFILVISYGRYCLLVNADDAASVITGADICAAIPTKPALVDNILNKFAALAKVPAIEDNYPYSVGYVEFPSNQDDLKAGGLQCKTFFTGLLSAFQQDLQKNKQLIQNLEQELEQFFNDNIGTLQSLS
jgi:hypothetical protein